MVTHWTHYPKLKVRILFLLPNKNRDGLDEVLDKLEKEEDLKLTIDTKNDMDVHEIKEILKNYIDKEKINVSITVDTEY